MKQELLKQINLTEFHRGTSVTVISNGCVAIIKIDQITHVSRYGNETVIYTLRNNFRTYYSPEEILNDLPANDFSGYTSHILLLYDT